MVDSSMNFCSSKIDNNNGLQVHYLHSGDKGKPLCLMIHGYPETSYCWRHQLDAVSKHGNGYFVAAPDLRGFGQTTGWEWAKGHFGEDSKLGCAADASFSALNMVQDIVGFIQALGYDSCILVGHDFGTTFSFYTALARPEIVKGLFLISVPLGLGPRPLAEHVDNRTQQEYAKFRKAGMMHYQDYYCQPTTAEYFEANTEQFLRNSYAALTGGSQQLESFRYPSSRQKEFWAGQGSDWAEHATRLFPMAIPNGMNYIELCGGSTDSALPQWLSRHEFENIVAQFQHSGFQGALAMYRNIQKNVNDFAFLGGRQLTVPYFFLGGEKDFVLVMYRTLLKNLGVDHIPKFVEKRVLPGVGHWVQSEAPAETNRAICDFLDAIDSELLSSKL